VQRDSIQIDEREKGDAKPLKLARKRNPVREERNDNSKKN